MAQPMTKSGRNGRANRSGSKGSPVRRASFRAHKELSIFFFSAFMRASDAATRLQNASAVNENVHQLAEGVACVEAADAPGFVRRPVFDGQSCLTDPGQRFLEVVDLNG